VRADTLSSRIFLALAALLVVLLGAALISGEYLLRRVVGDDIEQRKIMVCDILARPALDVLAQRAERAEFQRRLQDVGSTEQLRLTVITVDGSVVADSDVTGPLVNHLDRPEVQAALATGTGRAERRSTTTGKETVYLARSLVADGRTLGVLRAAVEIDELESLLGSLRTGIVWFGVIALGLGLVCVVLLTRWLARPLVAIESSAARLAAGDLDTRIAAQGPREVRRLADTLNAMSSELRTRLENQRRARTEIETILASMAEGVVAVDANERVLLMNHAAATLLGLPEPVESGAALWEHVRFPDLEVALRDVLAGRGAWSGDAATPRADGRVLGLSVAPVGAEGDGQSLLGAVALLSDVTAIRRLEQVRIDFVANVSHELRTPLAAVIGALETLADAKQDDEVRERFLDIANRNAARLQAIVSDLLDLSSIEAEGDRMALEPVRVDAPLRTAASALVGAAESKGVRLELPPASTTPIQVNGNSQRLEQVFTNLLENAIKYTPRGGRVSARVRAGAREVSVDVEDTGVGIPAQHLPRVFERFYRVDRSRSRDMGGTGLGLAIVKHVLRAHGGQVSVQSEEGRGTTFTVTLPRLPEVARTARPKDGDRATPANGESTPARN